MAARSNKQVQRFYRVAEKHLGDAELLYEHGSKTGMVVRHGRIVGQWYFGDATPESKYIVYSTTKSFASTAAGLARSSPFA